MPPMKAVAVLAVIGAGYASVGLPVPGCDLVGSTEGVEALFAGAGVFVHTAPNASNAASGLVTRGVLVRNLLDFTDANSMYMQHQFAFDAVDGISVALGILDGVAPHS